MRRAPASLLLALLGLPLLAAVLACSMYLSSCSRRSNANLVTKRYELHGQIVRLDPQAHSAIISGQKIEGWMEAMTMEYPVKDQKEYQALHNGGGSGLPLLSRISTFGSPTFIVRRRKRK